MVLMMNHEIKIPEVKHFPGKNTIHYSRGDLMSQSIKVMKVMLPTSGCLNVSESKPGDYAQVTCRYAHENPRYARVPCIYFWCCVQIFYEFLAI